MLNIQRMNEVMKKSGLKKCYIAERIGLSPSQFAMVLTGRRKMQADEYAAFCTLFDASANDFVM